MTGKTNYTIYVPLGSSFSVSTTYACAPPEEVGYIFWGVENVSLAVISFSPHAEPFTLYFDLTNVEVTGNSSVSTLTVHNATMEYNGTLFARIEKYGSITTEGSLHPEHFFKVKVIISGILIASWEHGLYVPSYIINGVISWLPELQNDVMLGVLQ